MENITDNQFEELAVGFITETLSDEEQDLFLEVVRSSKSRRAQYLAIAESHALSFVTRFEAIKKLNYKMLISRPGMKGLQRTTPLRIAWARIAAVVLLCLTTGTSAYYVSKDIRNNKRSLTEIFELTVPHGSQLSLTLPDNTLVWLNSGSVLHYDHSYGRKERRVSLTGEGYFEVKKNPKQPFVVNSGEMNLTVLGTTFNIRNYMEEAAVEVSLIEGSLRLASSNNHAAGTVTLSPNQKASYLKNTGQFVTSSCDASKSARWTTGKLSFVNASVTSIMKDLERRYDVKIIIESHRLSGDYFSGSIDLNRPLEDVFNYLDVEHKYRWEQNGNVFTISDMD